jgi:ATP-dependent helicase HrpA
LYHQLDLTLATDFPPLWSDSIEDMRDQLAHLIYRGIVIATPFERLRHLPRYLRGIELRFKKLSNAGLTRDIQAMEEVGPLWRRYKTQAAAHRESRERRLELNEFRWLLEELRISLFAQELKTAVPVSARRLKALAS